MRQFPKARGLKASKGKRPDPKVGRKVKARAVVCLLTVALLIGSFAVFSNYERTPGTDAGRGPSQEQVLQPRTLADLLAMNPQDLADLDIGLVNLLCAEWLRGSEHLDLEGSLARLDEIARYVERETQRHLYRFRQAPQDYNHSEASFRMLFLTVVLQQDLKIRYNPERITSPGIYEPNDVFFADANDIFINGMTGERQMGTCSSLPVFYVAVGRRLGYPLKLVTAKNHLFVRWEDQRDRFNIDTTGIGFNSFDDNHYRQWPVPMTYDEEQRFGFLKSLTPAEELAVFLSNRGHCLLAAGRLQEALQTHEASLRYAADSESQKLVLAMARREAAMRSAPRAGGRPDPILQVAGDEADWAAYRAENLSRRRR